MCLQAISAEIDRVTYRVPAFHQRAEPDLAQAGDHINSVSGDAEGSEIGAKGQGEGGVEGVHGRHPHQHHQHGKNYHHTHGQYCDVLPQTDGERILIKVYS